jgi:hypothetical protein
VVNKLRISSESRNECSELIQGSRSRKIRNNGKTQDMDYRGLLKNLYMLWFETKEEMENSQLGKHFS